MKRQINDNFKLTVSKSSFFVCLLPWSREISLLWAAVTVRSWAIKLPKEINQRKLNISIFLPFREWITSSLSPCFAYFEPVYFYFAILTKRNDESYLYCINRENYFEVVYFKKSGQYMDKNDKISMTWPH